MPFHFSNQPIGRQIMIALAIAILALVGVSGVMVVQRWHDVANSRMVEALADVAAGIGDAVHELQRERGASALYIGSKGAQFAGELNQQRRLSDEKLAALNAMLADLRGDADFRPLFERLAAGERLLSDLGAKRRAITDLSVAGAQSFSYYTDTISNFLDSVYDLAALTQHPRTKDLVFGYAALLQAKERAGRERATGAAGFAGGRFDTTLYNRLISLIAEEESYFATFAANAHPTLKAVFDSEARGAAFQDVQKFRQTVIAAGIGGNVDSARAPEWFRGSTTWIDKLMLVEEKANVLLHNETAARTTRAVAEFAIVLVVALLGSALALLVGFVVQRSITAAVQGLTAATGKIADGDLHYAIPAMDRRDEVGQLARAISGIRAIGVDATRVKVALDSVSANVMMADTAGNIIYANPAVLKMLSAAEADVRRDLPSFRASAIVGAHFDSFHKNPAHQRNLLERLTGPYQAQISVGGHRFDLAAAPVVDHQGARLGTVVEWRDVTQLLRIEREVASMAESAAAGDFSRRIDTTGMEGFMLDLANRLNTLNQTSEKSLQAVADFLDAIANGDVGSRIHGDYAGMYGKIQEDANRTAEKLSEIVGNITASADTIATAASEVSAGTSDLADRTEQQASSLEQTAAAMEELSSTVRISADNAQQANQVAGEAQRAAGTGGAVASSAIDAMKRIEAASRKITEIIGVIDEIAFQTNLLALNAAVEAARAGDAGRGFAVVAQEVRQLAQRSAQASKEIKVLILDSDGQVKEGVDMVKRAGNALDDIVANVTQVAALISDMATAAAEQAESLDQVNTAVAQMDEMTQKNAALVEETTAATHELASQAGDLRSMISFFHNVHH